MRVPIKVIEKYCMRSITKSRKGKVLPIGANLYIYKYTQKYVLQHHILLHDLGTKLSGAVGIAKTSDIYIYKKKTNFLYSADFVKEELTSLETF